MYTGLLEILFSKPLCVCTKGVGGGGRGVGGWGGEGQSE